MKNIKALVKVEARAAILACLYFLVINIGLLLHTYNRINDRYRGYLQYMDWNSILDIHGQILLGAITTSSLFVFLGLIILIYFQFQNDKSIEIGRFIKSLPYTNGQRCMVKVLLGILSYTIPFIILAAGIMMMREYAIGRVSDYHNVLPYAEIIHILNSKENLINALVLNYVVYTAVYLFVFMLQYIVSHNIASLIIAALILLTPDFIRESIILQINYISLNGRNMEHAYKIINQIRDQISLPLYSIISNHNYLHFEKSGKGTYDYFNYNYIRAIDIKMIVGITIGLICIICLWQVGKRIRIEDADILMPYTLFRIIFMTGVVICSALLVADIGLFFVRGSRGIGMITSCTLGLIGGGVGYIVARKLAYIGIERRK